MKWSEVDMKLKIAVYLITIISFLTGVGTGVYKTFAKEAEFQAFVAMDKAREDRKSYMFYDAKVTTCKAQHGENFERATGEAKKECLWFKSERDLLMLKFQQKR